MSKNVNNLILIYSTSFDIILNILNERRINYGTF
nr:MAG TPA: hypothetical protein [Caudoviricetes sp.]